MGRAGLLELLIEGEHLIHPRDHELVVGYVIRFREVYGADRECFNIDAAKRVISSSEFWDNSFDNEIHNRTI